MKFLPLIWAGLRRKPVNPVLTLISMALATLLASLAMTAARVLPQGSGNELDKAVTVIAGIGFAVILFLTGNAMAQAVRERGWEFAVLRALGFSRRGVVILLFCELALPCVLGAVAGQGLAQLILVILSRLLAARMRIEPLLPLASVEVNFGSAIFVAFASMIVPGWRLSRLNLAVTLARGRHG